MHTFGGMHNILSLVEWPKIRVALPLSLSRAVSDMVGRWFCTPSDDCFWLGGKSTLHKQVQDGLVQFSDDLVVGPSAGKTFKKSSTCGPAESCSTCGATSLPLPFRRLRRLPDSQEESPAKSESLGSEDTTSSDHMESLAFDKDSLPDHMESLAFAEPLEPATDESSLLSPSTTETQEATSSSLKSGEDATDTAPYMRTRDGQLVELHSRYAVNVEDLTLIAPACHRPPKRSRFFGPGESK